MTLESIGLFSQVWPDPVGEILGTGFMRFESPLGIDGLAKMNGGTLEILAVKARKPGSGQFRNFITQCKKRVSEIYVLHDTNPIIGEALIRYGFTQCIKIEADGERVPAWRWASV